MSHVANIMVSVAYDDIPTVRTFSESLRTELAPNTRRPIGSLTEITGENHGWGGYKHPECIIWAGALNGADLAAVLRRAAGLPWQIPHAVQVFVKDQYEEFFRLWMLRDGELRQYAPVSPLESGG
ncbi:squamosa promoter-binding protein 15 [Nocardia sp. AG03]|uniref:squamosa promoter-binding protein 15 n=1 Tax=Nocardia sp. AG03 TaxID=3025312 RepID=UPI0024181F1B|nr:squamosa promoter-binding protein 15 [Nocardia sp. AG03]